MKRFFLFFTAIVFLTPMCTTYGEPAETPATLEAMKQEIAEMRGQFEKMQILYESKIKNLQARIERLEDVKGVPAQAGIDGTAPAGGGAGAVALAAQPQTAATGLSRAIQSFNPEISAIGDFIYHWTDDHRSDVYKQFQMRELELALSAAVDPYARADFFTALSYEDNEWRTDLEEGYLTLLTLPFEFQSKVGKFKSEFGKVNKLHPHSLLTVDYPLVMRRYFGEEGMSEPGVSLNHLVPNPWDLYSELTFQAFNNKNAPAFAGPDGRSIVCLTHMKNFFDITPVSTVEVGGSFAFGPNDDGHGGQMTFMEGLDLTYKWRDPKKGLYRSFVFQNELYLCQKDRASSDIVVAEEGGIDPTTGDNMSGTIASWPAAAERVDTWGMYSLAQYQFARRWYAFGRYDFSEFPDTEGMRDNAYSMGLTFAQSEFCFWRAQYEYTDRNYYKNEHAIWFQCNFGIGPHRKHEY